MLVFVCLSRFRLFFSRTSWHIVFARMTSDFVVPRSQQIFHVISGWVVELVLGFTRNISSLIIYNYTVIYILKIYKEKPTKKVRNALLQMKNFKKFTQILSNFYKLFYNDPIFRDSRWEASQGIKRH